jgi:hypothetical protein
MSAVGPAAAAGGSGVANQPPGPSDDGCVAGRLRPNLGAVDAGPEIRRAGTKGR